MREGGNHLFWVCIEAKRKVVEEERVGRIVLKMERETGKESGMTEG
jgi:hypothetical protein